MSEDERKGYYKQVETLPNGNVASEVMDVYQREESKTQGTTKQVIFDLKQNNEVNNKEDFKMTFKFIGIGAAGNKAAMELITSGVATEEDVILVNSTNKDIPKEFTGESIILSPSNNEIGRASCRERV